METLTRWTARALRVTRSRGSLFSGGPSAAPFPPQQPGQAGSAQDAEPWQVQRAVSGNSSSCVLIALRDGKQSETGSGGGWRALSIAVSALAALGSPG